MNQTEQKSEAPRPENRGGLKRTVMLIVLISSWTFVMGVMVGRNMMPVRFDVDRMNTKINQEVAALKKAFHQEELRRYRINTDALNATPDLEFHERLKSETTQADALDTMPLPEPAPVRAPQLTARKTVTAQTAEKAAPPASPPPSSTPALTATPPASGKSSYVIQVAAFRDLQVARQILSQLKAKGFDAAILTAQSADQRTWHRIRLSGFENREAAEVTMLMLRKNKFQPMLMRQ